jgi:hypothetical protein
VQSRRRQVLELAILIAVLVPADVLAYLDPGSGSLIFQTIVATLAGVAYGVRVYWSRIRGLFTGRGGTTPSDTSVDARADPKP